MIYEKLAKRQRQKRVRRKIQGTEEKPRLSVFRSNVFFSAQLIDDTKGVTLLGIIEKHSKETKGTKTEKAKILGKFLAEKAKEKKITTVIFDRGSYKYHGRVKSFAEGVREGGLSF